MNGSKVSVPAGIGAGAIRLGPNTGLEILDFDDRIAQVRMTQGTLNLWVRTLPRGQVYQVSVRAQ